MFNHTPPGDKGGVDTIHWAVTFAPLGKLYTTAEL